MLTFLPVHGQGGIKAWTLLDHADAGDLNRLHLHSTGYAYFCEGIGHTRTRKVRLHRHLMGVRDKKKIEVDHINHDPLDNRRSNLRLVTRQENAQNTSSHKDARSKHRGVDLHACGKWRARATINYETFDLGLHSTEEEAAEAAREFRAGHMPYSNEKRS